MFCSLLSATMAVGQQWVGVSAQSYLSSNITFSGSTKSVAEVNVEIPGFFQNAILFEGKTFQLPQIPEGHPILTQGSPDLQKLSFTLQLPANGNMQVSVATAEYKEYTDVDIIPSGGNIDRNGKTKALKKGRTYKNDEFFPGNLIDSQQPFIVRNARAQAFQVYPFQYNPVTRVLRFYYHLTFKIVNAGGDGDNPISEDFYRKKSIEGISARFINRESSGYKSGQLPSERGSLLIICPQSYRSAIEPLAEWRKQTGIETIIVNAEMFSESEQIYSFVKEYYTNNPDLAYLLLVGDSKQVPPHIYPNGASDNYYSYLDGNDHYPDILVGRFSAESVKDVEVQVNRTLQYEKDPGMDASWLANATGIGSTLSPGDDGESDFLHVRNLLKTLKTSTYNQYSEFFDGSQGESDAAGDPSASGIIDKINKGTGIIFYAGHGSPSAMSTGSVTKSVVEGLDNKGKFPLIWSAACDNGNFNSKYCIAEAWLRASKSNTQPTGALAAVMASGTQTSYPVMEAQDKIAEIISDPKEGLSTMGAITAKGMMSMNDVYGAAGYATTDTWILFGDPSLRIRTAIPKQLTADHKGTIGTGRISYAIKCNAASGYACISSQGIILGTAAITEGFATIFLNQPASGNTMTLTITALNYLPYIAEIEVIDAPESPGFSLPVNHSKLQLINTSFSWDSGEGGDPDYYLFYLGTDNPPSNLVNGEKLTSTQLKTQFNLEYATTYYWKVVPINKYGKADGKVMDFTTVFKPEEDFEPVFRTRSIWSDSGNQKWEHDESQYFEGTHSIRSGQIKDNESSSLVYPSEVTHCDFVSFWSKTSSDSGDKLQFLIDGTLMGEWSGMSEWSFHIYKVEPGKHKIEWRYTKDGIGLAGYDAAWVDNIHLPVHEPLTANIAEIAAVCEGSDFETSSTAYNYFTINWTTLGDGSFADNKLENAIYKPGALDIQNRVTLLQMRVEGFQGCPVLDKTMMLEINPVPVIALPSDTIIHSGSTVQLDAGMSGNMTYNWQPDGSNSSSILIDSTASVNGTKSTSVTITSPKGCSATKEMQIHFNNPALTDAFNIYPNPSNGNFTIEPVEGSATVDNMMLLDRGGNVVWKNNESCDIFGAKQLSISGLADGAYLLVTNNKKGRSVNTLVIQ